MVSLFNVVECLAVADEGEELGSHCEGYVKWGICMWGCGGTYL